MSPVVQKRRISKLFSFTIPLFISLTDSSNSPTAVAVHPCLRSRLAKREKKEESEAAADYLCNGFQAKFRSII
ncbi:hypothetical protein K7X08_006798 [Anisodus acutangulus]|uniref:Uncharacterized protein n=1 Tax=Anisodus acutangulus TaxID=402998 RepID=A0A9Q1RRS7_9SOLA|nr:hypothetical protein K7X08_006798 [Anisodus acutangulus]